MILALFTSSAASPVSVPETAYGPIERREERSLTEAEVAKLANADTEAIVRSYFRDIPIMIEIARCESTFRHELSDGSILQGRVDPDDTGVMQINRYYHEESAEQMKLDLDDLYHNMAYARHLYEEQGTQPWSASRPCWGQQLAANY